MSKFVCLDINLEYNQYGICALPKLVNTTSVVDNN